MLRSPVFVKGLQTLQQAQLHSLEPLGILKATGHQMVPALEPPSVQLVLCRDVCSRGYVPR